MPMKLKGRARTRWPLAQAKYAVQAWRLYCRSIAACNILLASV